MVNLDRDEKMGALYSGFLDRLADSSGFEFWSNQLDGNAELIDVSRSFFHSEEGQEKLGDLNNEELVDTMFQQLFNRPAGEEGLDFWTGELESGEVSEGHLMIALINGAQGTDKRAVEAKGEAGAAYAKADFNDLEFASQFETAIDATIDGLRDSASVGSLEISNEEFPEDKFHLSVEDEEGVEYNLDSNQESELGTVVAEGEEGLDLLVFSSTFGLQSDLDNGLLVG